MTRSTGARGGGGGGAQAAPETDPIATAALNTHKTSSDHDVHADARYTPAAHVSASTGAHAASAISVQASGLVVVTGNSVQSALSQLDTWAGARPTNTNGTLASRPAASGLPENSTYFATDDNLGTTYRVVSGAWVKQSGAVGDSGGRELGYVALGTGIAAANTADSAWHDVSGVQVAFTGGTRPVQVRTSIMFQIGLGTAGSGSLRRLSLGLTDAAGAGTLRDQSPWTAIISTGNVFLVRLICTYRFQPVSGTSYTFKAQQQTNVAGLSITVFGEDLSVESYIEAVER